MTSVTLALFPVVRELSVVRRACRQLVEVQLPAAKGPGASRIVPEVGALWAGLFSAGVNAIPPSPLKGSSPRPPGQSPPSFSRHHHQLRSLAVGAEGAGGGGEGAKLELVGTSSASRALSLFPSVPSGLALVLEPSAARAASDRHR